MNLGIGIRIRDRRIELGMTQAELGSKAGGKSKQFISRVEHGEDNLKSSTVEQFAKALHCSVSYIMGWEEAEQSPENANALADIFADKRMMEMNRKALQLSEERKQELFRFVNYLFTEETADKNP